MNKTRPKFQCCKCERCFGQVVDLEGEPVIILECPYCGAQCKVDLAPYRQRVVVVHRGAETGPGTDTGRWELPGTVPTHPLDDPAGD